MFQWLALVHIGHPFMCRWSWLTLVDSENMFGIPQMMDDNGWCFMMMVNNNNQSKILRWDDHGYWPKHWPTQITGFCRQMYHTWSVLVYIYNKRAQKLRKPMQITYSHLQMFCFAMFTIGFTWQCTPKRTSSSFWCRYYSMNRMTHKQSFRSFSHRPCYFTTCLRFNRLPCGLKSQRVETTHEWFGYGSWTTTAAVVRIQLNQGLVMTHYNRVWWLMMVITNSGYND